MHKSFFFFIKGNLAIENCHGEDKFYSHITEFQGILIFIVGGEESPVTFAMGHKCHFSSNEESCRLIAFHF